MGQARVLAMMGAGGGSAGWRHQGVAAGMGKVRLGMVQSLGDKLADCNPD
jgi:hypothetical protein